METLRGGGPLDYRTPPPAPDALWRVLEDRDALHEVRAAAAVALGPTLDRAGKERFTKLKADAPYRLRVMLRFARGSDTAAIAKALAKCCED